MASVIIDQCRKSYGNHEVVHGVDLEIGDEEFVVLVGPSGCGKSTLLRMIAGLEEITAGRISIGDRIVNHLPPKDRDIAMVFQNYALYPHLTVYENMAFGMMLRREPAALIGRRVEDTARMLGLGDYLKRYPRQLSGGQRQRVAMGRAIVRRPQVFLFDEPLSNLDAKLRVQMRTEIKALHRDVRTTSVYVTHDQIEAMTLADRVVVLKDGNIMQVGSPLELYDRPANLFVAGFIGSPMMNFIDGVLERDGEDVRAQLSGGATMNLPAGTCGRDGEEVTLGVRPEHLSIRDADAEGALPAMAVFTEPTGADTLVIAQVDGREISVSTRTRPQIRSSQAIGLTAETENIHVFAPGTGQRLS